MEESQKICNPLISVVIPVYNRQKVIGRLLEALEQQTYSNIEIVCVDDGSKDETQHIVQKHMDKDARIILKTKENGGAVSAVCMGIRETRGKYICFVDSDDIIGRDYIQNYVDQLDKEYDFIAFGFYYEDGICKKTILFKRDSNLRKRTVRYIQRPGFN